MLERTCTYYSPKSHTETHNPVRSTPSQATANDRVWVWTFGCQSKLSVEPRAVAETSSAGRKREERDAICKDRKDCSQSCGGGACARWLAEPDCEHEGTGGREALSENVAACAVSDGPGCCNRVGAKRRSGGHFKGCVGFGADAQRLGNSGHRDERFRVHGGASMDGQHRLLRHLESEDERGDLPQSSGCAVDPADLSEDDGNDAGWSGFCKRAHRRYSRSVCEERDSAGGAGGNELYDVQGCLPYPFGPITQFMPRDVFPADKSCW